MRKLLLIFLLSTFNFYAFSQDLHQISKIDKFYGTYPSTPTKIDKDVLKVIVPTIILTEANTASAAEDFLIYTDKQPHIKRMGNFTNGSTGQPLTVSLPNGGEAWICTKKVTFPDGTEFIGKGIRPDIKAEYTLRDFLKNEDSVLSKAIEELN